MLFTSKLWYIYIIEEYSEIEPMNFRPEKICMKVKCPRLPSSNQSEKVRLCAITMVGYSGKVNEKNKAVNRSVEGREDY
jgi:hypothetical protein